MTRKDFVVLMREIEDNIPVSEWKYGDMQIWPIIKKDIFFNWISKETPAKPINRSKLSKVLDIINSFVWYLMLKIQKKKLVDTIFIGAASHRVDYESFFINRYFYPIVKKDPQNNVLHLEYGTKTIGKNYNDLDITIFVKKIIPAFLIRNILTKQNINIPQWNEFANIIEKRMHLSLTKYRLRLRSHLHSIYSTSKAYQFLFNKFQPSKILSLCYYKNETLAMHYAANKLNIENTDVQHGAQGPLHVMYNFSNPPVTGYNTLPNIFWCWDKASANTILKWVNNQDYHKVIVGGNPWIEFQLTHFRHERLANKKIVLYTLQEEALDTYILDAIKMTQTDYEWWLRLHPRMLTAKENIQTQLKDRNLLDFVEIEKATRLPLPVLLKNSSVHISKYSGSIIEAVQINTPNIIIDKIGVDTYSEYVKSGDVKVVTSSNAEELVNVIKSLTEGLT